MAALDQVLMEHFVVAATAVFVSACTLYWFVSCMVEDDIWAIGIYAGLDPLVLTPHRSVARQPVLTARDVSDARALFVADPFLVRINKSWLMFFEVWNLDSGRGEIAYASSADGLKWTYQRLVLREPFHLSYPQVVEADGTFYMIPESAEAGVVQLYEAVDFPHGWRCVGPLLVGHYLDATVVRNGDSWFMFALRNNRETALFNAPRLEGPWLEHPCSPICQDQRFRRPAGRLVRSQRGVFRFAQDGTGTYGRSVFATKVHELSPECFSETPDIARSIITGTGAGWNMDGMHHIDAQPVDDGSWLAAVDGKTVRTRFNWRKGARALIDAFAPKESRKGSTC